MSVVSLFSGIGGLEVGLEQHGFEAELLCDVDPAAIAVLDEWFPEVPLHDDVQTLKSLPVCEVLTAGFPYVRDYRIGGSSP